MPFGKSGPVVVEPCAFRRQGRFAFFEAVRGLAGCGSQLVERAKACRSGPANIDKEYCKPEKDNLVRFFCCGKIVLLTFVDHRRKPHIGAAARMRRAAGLSTTVKRTKTMDRTTVQDALNPDCPIRNVLARIGDKWSLLVIYTLSGARTMRFGALQRAIPDISQKMLSVTLRTLEEDGYLTRRVYAEVPPRVEYTLTARAQSLLTCVDPLIEWAEANMPAILDDRRAARGGR